MIATKANSNRTPTSVGKRKMARNDKPSNDIQKAKQQDASSSWEHGPAQAAAGSGIERKQVLTLLVLSLALAIIVLDATIVIVALPKISNDFQISLKDLE